MDIEEHISRYFGDEEELLLRERLGQHHQQARAQAGRAEGPGDRDIDDKLNMLEQQRKLYPAKPLDAETSPD